MKKFRVHVQKDLFETYEVEAENQEMAELVYENEGTKISENSVIVSENAVEQK